MYIDPELAASLDPAWTPRWDLEATRRASDEAFADQTIEVPGAALNVTEVGGMEVRVWHPTASEPVRIIYAIHGGGYTSGRAIYDDQRNAEMAAEFSALVIAPDYRLAPEHPYPDPADDCLIGLDWAIERTGNLPLFLFGDSAGAGLVETVAARHLDRGGKPLAGLICLEPAVDPLGASQSMDTYAEGPAWSKEKARESWACYLGDTEPSALPRLGPRASRPDFPPILVFINPVDPLRDEGAAWAFNLADSGAPIEMHMLPGTYHGALSVPGTRTWRRVQDIMQTFLDREHGEEGRG